MRVALVPLVVWLLACRGCYQPSIEGLIDPDGECEFSTEGSIRKSGILDVGPVETLAHGYEGVMLVQGRTGDEVTSASVAFSSNGDRLPNVTIDGEPFVFPSVEGERHSQVAGTVDSGGLAAVPFTLVTKEEAVALQALTQAGEDLDMLIELRAVVGGTDTTLPSFVEIRICEMCLVGVGAELEGSELVCPDGSAPAPVDPLPCTEGQDDIFSTCDPQ